MGTDHEEIPEWGVHHPQLTSPTERRTFNLRPWKLRNYYKHLGVDDYVHAQVVHYTMTQYSLRKGVNRFKNVGEASVKKEMNQLHTKINFATINV